MQKRNPAVLMGVGRVTKTGRKDGAFRFPVPSYADYQPSRDYPEIRQELERMNQEINRIGVNINQITHNNNSALYSREDKHRLYVFLKQIKTLVSQVQERL